MTGGDNNGAFSTHTDIIQKNNLIWCLDVFFLSSGLEVRISFVMQFRETVKRTAAL